MKNKFVSSIFGKFTEIYPHNIVRELAGIHTSLKGVLIAIIFFSNTENKGLS